jgi:hypothetical protein
MAAKKKPARKPAKKVATRKPATKRTTAKKAPAKPARKPAKKTPAKKPAARKPAKRAGPATKVKCESSCHAGKRRRPAAKPVSAPVEQAVVEREPCGYCGAAPHFDDFGAAMPCPTPTDPAAKPEV